MDEGHKDVLANSSPMKTFSRKSHMQIFAAKNFFLFFKTFQEKFSVVLHCSTEDFAYR